MNMEKAIEFIHWAEDSFYVGDTTRDENIAFCSQGNEVISLLRQGEVNSKELKIVKEELKKVWQMWEEFKFKRGDTYAILEQPDKGTIRDDMNNFEQKYFKEG